MALTGPAYKPIEQIIAEIESGTKTVILPIRHWEILQEAIEEIGLEVHWQYSIQGKIVYVKKAINIVGS